MTSRTATSSDGYRAIGEWYDAEHDAVTEDVELFLQLAEVVGDPILELGCGTGRIIAALAAKGHRVTGVDRSTEMLDRARGRLGDLVESGSATLIDGPMDRAPAGHEGRYGLVLLSHNTLLHATSSDEQRAVLAAARAALDPRGMLVVDVINPVADVRHPDPGRVSFEGTWATAAGGEVSKFSSRSVDEAAQSIATTIWYDTVANDGTVRRTVTGLDLRYVSAAELLLMLELTGFVDPLLYGSYDLEPYVEDSPRILATAEVTRTP